MRVHEWLPLEDDKDRGHERPGCGPGTDLATPNGRTRSGSWKSCALWRKREAKARPACMRAYRMEIATLEATIKAGEMHRFTAGAS